MHVSDQVTWNSEEIKHVAVTIVMLAGGNSYNTIISQLVENSVR